MPKIETRPNTLAKARDELDKAAATIADLETKLAEAQTAAASVAALESQLAAAKAATAPAAPPPPAARPASPLERISRSVKTR